jgi:choline dehydrogenase
MMATAGQAFENPVTGERMLFNKTTHETNGTLLDIEFFYFDEGNDHTGEDLQAVVNGIEFVRRMMQHAGSVIQKEFIPGKCVQTQEEIKQFIKDQAWGHHASCTCKIGPREDNMAVVDSRFRVHGTRNLRIVDASVFPHIPGFFIVSAIYMISEKASDVILADALETSAHADVRRGKAYKRMLAHRSS